MVQNLERRGLQGIMELQALINELKSEAHQTRLKKIAEMIEGYTVLDVGAGAGQLKDHLASHKTYKAVDAEPSFVEHMRSIGLDATIGNAEHLALHDNSYETVILGELLEHLKNPGRALDEALRIASKQIILTLPKDHTWEEHAWLFSWTTMDSWIIITIKPNPNFKPEHQEFPQR